MATLSAQSHCVKRSTPGGYPLAACASVLVPTTGASSEALYGITASSTANVAYLYPG